MKIRLLSKKRSIWINDIFDVTGIANRNIDIYYEHSVHGTGRYCYNDHELIDQGPRLNKCADVFRFVFLSFSRKPYIFKNVEK